MTKKFFEEYFYKISSSLTNNYTNNYDYFRFGKLETTKNKWSLKSILRMLLQRKGYISSEMIQRLLLKSFQLVLPFIDRFQWLYDQLNDSESKDLLIQVLAFRSLGNTKIKLPLSTPEYWESINNIEKHTSKSDFIQLSFHNWKLYRINLDSLHFPLSLYFTNKAVYTIFGLQQYKCVTEKGSIQADKGDYVIDGGGCWGDTALYFSHMVGQQGRVFSFEFIPSNLEIMQNNFNINPALKDRITVLDHALWNESDLPIYYIDNGPGSKVSLSPQVNDEWEQTSTLTIDDLVQRKNLPRVDFIKMDIEGAEVLALQGAINTLKSFRPKLAISLYHQLSDFLDIPEFLASLDLGYRFYIRHFTIYAEETVLFAEADESD